MNSVDSFFLEYEGKRESAIEICKKATTEITYALGDGNTREFLKWKVYLESDEVRKVLSYSSELNRLLRILTILQIEMLCKESGESFFSDGIESYQGLLDRYLKTVFSVRRLLFRLSEESAKDGLLFLEACRVSPFAIHVVLQYEMQDQGERTYHTLADALAEIWTGEEQRIFLELSGRQMEG